MRTAERSPPSCFCRLMACPLDKFTDTRLPLSNFLPSRS
jgi:hypothetical protein